MAIANHEPGYPERDLAILSFHSAVEELLGHVTIAEVEELFAFAVNEALDAPVYTTATLSA